MDKRTVVALKAMIVRGEKALIVKRAMDDEIGGGSWEFAGGKQEWGEKLQEALQREVLEEAGLTVQVGKLLYATTFLTDPKRQVVILTYLCHNLDGEVRLSPEHSDFLWAGKAELYALLPEPILNDIEDNAVFDALHIL